MMNEKKGLIVKVLIFLVPLGLLLIFPIIVLFVGREYYSVHKIIETQFSKPETLFCFAHSNVNKQYKEMLISKIKPDIIALGTSRISEFRSEFFLKSVKFGNAGNIVANMDDIENFALDLPKDSGIKQIILGLDQEMFFGIEPAIDQNFFERFSNMILRSRTIYIDYYSKRFSLSDLFRKSRETSNIGLIALIDNRGYRIDGSFRDGNILNDQESFVGSIRNAINDRVEKIKDNRGDFLYGKKIQEESLIRLDNSLRIFKEKGIDIIGYISPYPNAFYKEMMSIDDEYKEVILEISKRTSEIFYKNNFDFYDISDISKLHASDDEFSDINHGTDKLFLRITIYLAENNLSLKKVVDLKSLKSLLNKTSKDYLEEKIVLIN